MRRFICCTNCPIATGSWSTQTPQTITDTDVNLFRRPGGGPELSVSLEVETLATGSVSLSSLDVTSGFAPIALVFTGPLGGGLAGVAGWGCQGTGSPPPLP